MGRGRRDGRLGRRDAGADDRAARVRRRLRGDPRARLLLDLDLPRTLGGLDSRDLAPDRGEQRSALRELARDPRLLGGALLHDARLRRVRAPQRLLVALHGRLEGRDLPDDLRVLARDARLGVDPAEEVAQARRSEQHADPAHVVARRVHLHEPARQRLLRALEVRPRHDEVVPVLALGGLDLPELVGGRVVGLDRVLHARVDLLDLGEHPACLGLLRRDGRLGGGGGGGEQREGQDDDERMCLTFSRATQEVRGLGALTAHRSVRYAQVRHPSRGIGRAQPRN